MATPLPGPGLVGRGPGQWVDVDRGVDRDRPDCRTGNGRAVAVAVTDPRALLASRRGGHRDGRSPQGEQNGRSRRGGARPGPGSSPPDDSEPLDAAVERDRSARSWSPPARSVRQAAVGGGLQSMGLGAATNREGAFGEFRATGGPVGLQSIPATDESRSRQVTVPVGETIDLSIPAVCLNFGLPSPTPRDTFTLQDVDDYSSDPRVRKALRSLATLGTSHGVAQAAMWRVCNDLPFETMAAQTGKVMNLQEIALAARFVEALDASNSSGLVDCGGPVRVTRVRPGARAKGNWPARPSGWAANSMDCGSWGCRFKSSSPTSFPLPRPRRCSSRSSSDASPRPEMRTAGSSSARAPRATHGSPWARSFSVTPPRFRARRRHIVDDDRSCGRLGVCHRQASPANGRQHDLEGREPPPLHRRESGRQGGNIVGIAFGHLRGCRRRTRLVRSLLPIQAATASLVEHVELNGL